MNCSTPGLPVHHQLPEFTQTMSIESVMPSNHLILCLPLLPPSIFPSIGVFSNESVLCIRWPKYWSFSFNISPSNEHPGLISFGMDWLDLLAGYDLNQLPYDYVVGVTDIFKGLGLIECLKNYGQRLLTLYRRQWSRPSPWKGNIQRHNCCLKRPYK